MTNDPGGIIGRGKKHMRSKTILALLILMACAIISNAQHKKSVKRVDGERLITAFAHSKSLPSNFGDDGVFVGDPSPDVLRIIRLGKLAIPLLIRHLDDRRVFSHMEFCCSGTSGVQKIMVGEGALNILARIVHETAPMFDRECLEGRAKGNSEGDCIADSYNSGRRRKQNWLRAYRAGRVQYHKYEY